MADESFERGRMKIFDGGNQSGEVLRGQWAFDKAYPVNKLVGHYLSR